MVKDGGATYSALPHSVLRRSDLAPAVRLLYAILQEYAWQDSECRASHDTMAAELGCSTRMLRTYLDKLIGAGLVTEHDSGYRRQKVYRLVSIGSTVPIEPPVNEKQASDYQYPSRKFPTVQSEISDTFNRKSASDSKKKTPEKKTKEKESTGVPEVVVGADRATASADQATILRALSDDARDVLDWWRQCHGKKRPPRLNPTQARLLEEAVADLGVPRLKEAVQYMAGKGVSEIDKARTAAYTKRDRDDEAGISSPPAPHVNGTAPTVTPATPDDIAIWQRAVGLAATTMNQSNVDAYLSPLVVAGRIEGGGLCLVAPLSIGPDLKRFKGHITRALEDAGDPCPTAVAFKARRQETSHAE